MEKKKVLLGMSGGVDSSTSAILLLKQGYEVVGATMILYKEDSSAEDAKKICDNLGIKHYVFDFREEFKNCVIKNFIESYADSKTPNPCIECNKYMKFGLLFEKAKELNCDFVATGHYAKKVFNEEYNKFVIEKSNNLAKDQSYVLWKIPKEIIPNIIFPLSDFETKDEIRALAKDNGIESYDKPDSEDICFIPDGNYKEFLEKNSDIKPKPGNIVNRDGKVLGKHTGLYNYTIGQRKGLGITNPVPLFVLGFNKEKNEVIVGEESELYQKELLVTDINLLLIDKIEGSIKVDVKTRYSTKSFKAEIMQENNMIKVIFDEQQRAITPGQSAVFYKDNILFGGGIIFK